MTATSVDDGCDGWVFRVVVGLAERFVKGVDGIALEADSDVRVDGRSDADVGVAQQFLDNDEFHSLLQEEKAAE